MKVLYAYSGPCQVASVVHKIIGLPSSKDSHRILAYHQRHLLTTCYQAATLLIALLTVLL
jgi:hypothetical protein